MAERSKAHAWKVCIRQRIKGSNPFLSANHKLMIYKDIFIWLANKQFLLHKTVTQKEMNGAKISYLCQTEKDFFRAYYPT